MAIPTGPKEKAARRKEAKSLLSEVEPRHAAEWAERIVQHLAAWLTDHAVRGPVATFSSLPGEPDLRRLLSLCRGQTFLYPLVGPEHALTFHAVEALETLKPGSFGVLEPDPNRHPAVPPDSIGAILCPGLAFAADGARLGRGKAFYDRFLQTLPGDCPRVGVAFGLQLEIPVPTERHDQRMTHLVTEAGLMDITPSEGRA